MENKKNPTSMDEKTDKVDKEQNSRRGFLKGAFLGALISSAFSSTNAHADPVGGDTAAIANLRLWLEEKWNFYIVPGIKVAKDSYEDVKKWRDDWNKFTAAVNKEVGYVDEIKTFVTKADKNWLYLSFQELKSYINDMMKVDGDILKYRLHTYDPYLIRKIDSTIDELSSIVRRAHLTVNSYQNLGAPNDPDAFRKTKEGRLAIRSTNDQGKYLEMQSRNIALKQTMGEINKLVDKLKDKNNSIENIAKIHHDLIAPLMLESSLLTNSILIESYGKQNDISLILSKEEPLITKEEKVVTKDDFKKILDDLFKGNKKGFIF